MEFVVTLGWFKSYLTNRKHCPSMDTHLNSRMPFVASLKVQSLAHLILIYVNDMPNTSKKLLFSFC